MKTMRTESAEKMTWRHESVDDLGVRLALKEQGKACDMWKLLGLNQQELVVKTIPSLTTWGIQGSSINLAHLSPVNSRGYMVGHGKTKYHENAAKTPPKIGAFCGSKSI